MEAFPASFGADVEAYLGRHAHPDVFAKDYSRPLRPITIRQRRQRLLLLATALTDTGFPIDRITSLKTLVEVDNAEALLRLLYERGEQEPTEYLAQLATLLKTVARDHVRVDEGHLQRLGDFVRGLKPEASGFTKKNRAFLRQFADPNNIRRLVQMPGDVVAEVERHNHGFRRSALMVELALAVAIELIIPLRMENLSGLRIDRHLWWSDRGGIVLIPILAEETKNGCAIEAQLPATVVKLLNLYLKIYRPRLAGPDSSWLFPGEKGKRRQSGGFGAQLGKFIHDQTGLRMTPHQFRHLAAKLYLDAHPGDYETVRRLLGHKSVATTMRFYQELDTMMATRRYAEIITELVEERSKDHESDSDHGEDSDE